MNPSRLATVVRVRRLQERVARGALAGARRDVDARERDRADCRRIVEEGAATTPPRAGAFAAHRQALAVGMDTVRDAETAVVAAHAHVATALDHWRDAGARREGVERLDERVTIAAQHELDRRTSAELDDLTVLRWNRTRAADAPERPLDGAP